jgi:hypothetical protein
MRTRMVSADKEARRNEMTSRPVDSTRSTATDEPVALCQS